MSEWQPIDSAPKDGTTVMLWIPLEDQTIADQNKFREACLFPKCSYIGKEWCDDAGELEMAFGDPTHWQPLPAPPAKRRSEMSERDDGGPAFPVPEVRGSDGCGIMEGSPGMSLRDWFAGQSLRALGTTTPSLPNEGPPPNTLQGHINRRAQWAYAQADAMIAERAKR